MSESEKPFHVDEDWKARAQAEKAAAAAKSAPSEPSPAAERPAQKPAAAQAEPEFPAASMLLLISTLATQTLIALGHDPRGEREGPPRMAEAKHFIDMLAVLEEKTKGNLSQMEAGALEDVLHQLRMAFVQAKKG